MAQCAFRCGRLAHKGCLPGGATWGCLECIDRAALAGVHDAHDCLWRAKAKLAGAEAGAAAADKAINKTVDGPVQDAWGCAQRGVGVDKQSHPTYAYVGGHVRKLILGSHKQLRLTWASSAAAPIIEGLRGRAGELDEGAVAEFHGALDQVAAGMVKLGEDLEGFCSRWRRVHEIAASVGYIPKAKQAELAAACGGCAAWVRAHAGLRFVTKGHYIESHLPTFVGTWGLGYGTTGGGGFEPPHHHMGAELTTYDSQKRQPTAMPPPRGAGAPSKAPRRAQRQGARSAGSVPPGPEQSPVRPRWCGTAGSGGRRSRNNKPAPHQPTSRRCTAPRPKPGRRRRRGAAGDGSTGCYC